MKITATPIIARHLQPGDLFSTADQHYWNAAMNGARGSIGERLYVRTTVDAYSSPDFDAVVYKIEIEREVPSHVVIDQPSETNQT